MAIFALMAPFAFAAKQRNARENAIAYLEALRAVNSLPAFDDDADIFVTHDHRAAGLSSSLYILTSVAQIFAGDFRLSSRRNRHLRNIRHVEFLAFQFCLGLP